MRTKLETIAATAKKHTNVNDSLQEIRVRLFALLNTEFDSDKIIICDKDKPAAGRAFAVIELSDRFRINYRCGYSRYNYAPCIEVMK